MNSLKLLFDCHIVLMGEFMHVKCIKKALYFVCLFIKLHIIISIKLVRNSLNFTWDGKRSKTKNTMRWDNYGINDLSNKNYITFVQHLDLYSRGHWTYILSRLKYSYQYSSLYITNRPSLSFNACDDHRLPINHNTTLRYPMSF